MTEILYDNGQIQVKRFEKNQGYVVGIKEKNSSKYAYYLLMTEDLKEFASGTPERFERRLKNQNRVMFRKLNDCFLSIYEAQVALLQASSNKNRIKEETIEKKV